MPPSEANKALDVKNAVYHLNHNKNFKNIITESMLEQLEISVNNIDRDLIHHIDAVMMTAVS